MENRFGGGGSNASGTRGLFVATSSSGADQKPLFGAPTSGSPSSGLFSGNAPAPKTGNAGLFGAATSTPKSTPTTSGAPLFGQGQSTAGGGFSFKPQGGPPASSTPTSNPATNTFGKTGTGGTDLFPQSSTPAGNPPAAAKPPGTIFGSVAASNTPAGQPASGSLFGQNKQGEQTAASNTSGSFFSGKPGGSLFGSTPTATGAGSPLGSVGAPQTAAPNTGMFGKPVEKPIENKSATPLFGGPPTQSTTPASKPIFASTTTSSTPSVPAPASSGGLFGSAGTVKPGALFGNTSTATTTAPSSTPTPATGLFGSTPGTSKPAENAASSTPAATSSAPTSALFGNKTTTTSAPSTSTTSAPSTGNIFGKTATTSTPTTSTPTTASAVASATTAPTTGTTPALFGSAATASTSNVPTGAPAAAAAAAATQPPPQSRLKNKSMEEVITRWTSDLEKYKSEFQAQAEEVKKWDLVLIENGDKLINLVAETTEAEKTQARMETVLQQLENEQEELGTALDYYESQIKEIFSAQFGAGRDMQPADQEREKTYAMAERLSDTLSGMEGDLAEMIKAINKAGATINKTTNVDDPLSQIVKILNDHLASLQWIDTHTSQVSEKILEAQRKSSERSSMGGVLGGEDDYFPGASYRSLR